MSSVQCLGEVLDARSIRRLREPRIIVQVILPRSGLASLTEFDKI